MAKKITKAKGVETLYSNIRQVIEQARGSAYRAVNFAMVQAYWHIGKLIIEEEQSGKARAEYGEELIEKLSEKLSLEYGKGFNSTNLWYMRHARASRDAGLVGLAGNSLIPGSDRYGI